jgi:hypothetical protein
MASAGPIILAKPKQNAFLERRLRFSPALWREVRMRYASVIFATALACAPLPLGMSAPKSLRQSSPWPVTAAVLRAVVVQFAHCPMLAPIRRV